MGSPGTLHMRLRAGRSRRKSSRCVQERGEYHARTRTRTRTRTHTRTRTNIHAQIFTRPHHHHPHNCLLLLRLHRVLTPLLLTHHHLDRRKHTPSHLLVRNGESGDAALRRQRRSWRRQSSMAAHPHDARRPRVKRCSSRLLQHLTCASAARAPCSPADGGHRQAYALRR